MERPERYQLLSELEEALQTLDNLFIAQSFTEVALQPGSQQRADKVIEVRVLEKPARIIIEAKLSGYPRDMQLAAEQLLRYAAANSDGLTMPMVVAPTISPGGRRVLREKGIAYWDRSGSLYLPLPWAHYDIERPAKQAPARRVRSLYQGRSARVLHALLHNPERAWHVDALAAEAGVSPYTAHRVLVALEQELWVERSGRGPQSVRLLREPGALLDTWADEHTLRRYQQWGYFGWARSAAALLPQLTDLLNRQSFHYALTLESGAARVAPLATSVERISILVPTHTDLEQFAMTAKLELAEEGANVIFLKTVEEGPFLYRQKVEHSWVANPVQLYLDLWNWPRRGREQAAHLRREWLSF